MKLFVQILLVVLFLLQGTNTYNPLILACFAVLLLTNISLNSTKIKWPVYFLMAMLIYGFYLSIGLFYKHPEPTIDIKFQVFSFIFYFWLINQRYKFNMLKLLLIINVIVFILYLGLYLDVLPNLWRGKGRTGFRGSLYGPTIISMVLIGFYYLYYNKKFDWKLAVSAILALPYIVLSSNFMNLGIMIGLIFLIVVDLKKLFNPLYISVIMILIIAGLVFLQSSMVPELVKTKLSYVYRPWEYASLRIRIEDLLRAIRSENYTTLEAIFGKGYGASSTIFRENKIAVSYQGFYTFQEIDNGFYYIFHRGGFSLLSLFILSHAYLVRKIPNLKAKLGFIIIILITNLLSIHYFNYYFYLLLPFVIINKPRLYK